MATARTKRLIARLEMQGPKLTMMERGVAARALRWALQSHRRWVKSGAKPFGWYDPMEEVIRELEGRG